MSPGSTVGSGAVLGGLLPPLPPPGPPGVPAGWPGLDGIGAGFGLTGVGAPMLFTPFSYSMVSVAYGARLSPVFWRKCATVTTRLGVARNVGTVGP
jgi:hypothetical protein